MTNIRVIPRLDIKGPNLVKGVHLEGLRVLGKPEDFARYYYETGADELLYMDAVASLYGRNSLLEIVDRTASEMFIPLCVGGGLRSVADIREVLRAGADKVAINTAALGDPSVIDAASVAFGSSTIVVSIAAQRAPDGTFQCFIEGGREPAHVEARAWAIEAVERGAGEVLLTSIDREGTGTGFDLELVRTVATAVEVPVIASGGAGKMDHVEQVITETRADAVGLASLLHYAAIEELPFESGGYTDEGNVEFRRSASVRSHLHATSIPELKAFLAAAGVEVRRSSAVA